MLSFLLKVDKLEPLQCGIVLSRLRLFQNTLSILKVWRRALPVSYLLLALFGKKSIMLGAGFISVIPGLFILLLWNSARFNLNKLIFALNMAGFRSFKKVNQLSHKKIPLYPWVPAAKDILLKISLIMKNLWENTIKFRYLPPTVNNYISFVTMTYGSKSVIMHGNWVTFENMFLLMKMANDDKYFFHLSTEL